MFKEIIFPSGEVHTTLLINSLEERNDLECGHVLILENPSNNDLFGLAMKVETLRRYSVENLILDIPYFPGSRQDRVINDNESFDLKVYANFINSLQFNEVHITNPHSYVTPALINNVYVSNGFDFFIQGINIIAESKGSNNNTIDIVIPDAGATKKVEDLVMEISKIYPNTIFNTIQCLKKRDPATGKLSGFRVLGNYDKFVPKVIIDDICDGGGTFIGLAKEFEGCEDLSLLVTHGFFSKGKEELQKHFVTVKSQYDYSKQ